MRATRTRLPVYILAGGASRRFGPGDKARALLRGRPLIQHVVAGLEPHAARVRVVADVEAKYSDLGLHTLADEPPGQGPLGGLVRALEDLSQSSPDEPRLLLASCDLLGVEPAWVAALLEARRDGAQGVAFRGERWQPLPALYHGSLLAPARAALAGRQRALWRVMEAASPVALPLPAGWSRAVQINTREDLARAGELPAGGPGMR